jgi:hypothetical protein
MEMEVEQAALLPHFVLVSIFYSLPDLPSLHSSLLLCKRWSSAVSKNEEFWEHVVNNVLIPNNKLPFIPQTLIPAHRSWNWLCHCSSTFKENNQELCPSQDSNLPLNFSGVASIRTPVGAYHGEFLNGMKHGKGMLQFDGIKARFEGDFDQDERTNGLMLWNDGDSYQGEVLKGKLHGKGKYSFANGDKFEGHFKEGKRNGEGTFTWEDGDYYQGNFHEDFRNGLGVFCWSKMGRKYEGEFKDGECTGKAKYSFQNGDRYEGEFFERFAKGEKGIYTFENGDYVEMNITTKSAVFYEISQRTEEDITMGLSGSLEVAPGQNHPTSDHSLEYSQLRLDDGRVLRLLVKIV